MMPDSAAHDSVSLTMFRSEMAWLRQVMEARLDAMDRAAVLLSESLYRVPTVLDLEVSKLKAMVDEKFGGVERILHEREKQRDLVTAAAERAVAAALSAAKEAVAKAEVANEKRFDGVNEFRTTLADQTALLMPRAEVDARLSALSEKTSDLVTRFDRAEGKGVSRSTYDDKIESILGRLDRGDGKAAGNSTLWLAITGAIAAIGTIMNISLVLYTASHR